MRVSLMPPDLMISVGFQSHYIDIHKNDNTETDFTVPLSPFAIAESYGIIALALKTDETNGGTYSNSSPLVKPNLRPSSLLRQGLISIEKKYDPKLPSSVPCAIKPEDRATVAFALGTLPLLPMFCPAIEIPKQSQHLSP